MSAHAGRQPDLGYRLAFADQSAGLRAHLSGRGGLPEVRACWMELAAEARRRDARALLLIDELEGAPLRPEEWKSLVAGMAGQGLERLRIAHVKPRGLEKLEYCEIYAREAGLVARVFVDERAASLWLRYGER